MVSPLAYNDRTISSTSPRRRWRFLTICGSNVPARSRGTSISTGPVFAGSTVLERVPLRMFSAPIPGRVVLLIAEMLGHLLAQRGLDHRLGQLLEQPVRAGQRQALLLGQPDQLGRSLLLSRQLRRLPLGHIVQCCSHHLHLPRRAVGSACQARNTVRWTVPPRSEASPTGPLGWGGQAIDPGYRGAPDLIIRRSVESASYRHICHGGRWHTGQRRWGYRDRPVQSQQTFLVIGTREHLSHRPRGNGPLKSRSLNEICIDSLRHEAL